MNFDMTEEAKEEKEATTLNQTTLVNFAQFHNDMDRNINVIRQTLMDLYYGEVEKLHEHALTHKVFDRASEMANLESEAGARKLHKALEKKREEIVKEPGEFVRSVNKMVKVFRDKIDAAIIVYNEKRTAYAWEKDKERLALEKKQREETEKLQEKVIKEAEEKGIEMPPLPPIPVVKPQAKIRTGTGATATLKMEWTHEVVDFAKLDDCYKLENDKALKAAVKAGIREIPGVKIFEVAKSKVRI